MKKSLELNKRKLILEESRPSSSFKKIFNLTRRKGFKFTTSVLRKLSKEYNNRKRVKENGLSRNMLDINKSMKLLLITILSYMKR